MREESTRKGPYWTLFSERLLHKAIERKIKSLKGIGKRAMQLIDDMKVQDRKHWRQWFRK